MTNNIFRGNYVKNNPPYKSSMEFLAYVTCNILFNYYNDGNFIAPDKNYVTKQIVSFFGAENVYSKYIRDFLDKYMTFQSLKKYVYVSKDMLNAVRTARNLIEQIKSNGDSNSDECRHDLEDLINNDPTNYADLIICSIGYDHALTNKDFDFYATKIFVALADGLDKVLNSIDRKIANIDKNKYIDSLDLYIKNKGLSDIFVILNVEYVGDFVQLFAPTVFGAFILYYKEIIMLIDCLNTETFTYTYFYDNLLNTFSVLEKREERILINRYVNNLSYPQMNKQEHMTEDGMRSVLKKSEPILFDSIRERHVFFLLLCKNINYDLIKINDLLKLKINEERLLLVYYLLTKNNYLNSRDYFALLHKFGIYSHSLSDYDEFEQYFDKFFANWRYDTLNCNVFYSFLCREKPNLVKKFGPAAKDAHSIFAYIKKLNPSKYNYYAPFISKSFDADISSISLVYDYLKDFEHFSMKDASRFMDYMDIRREYYQNVLERASKTHLLVDEGEMVRKDCFHISDEDLKIIKDKLMFFTDGNDIIETKNFYVYSSFPQLDYKWNKYLLVGIAQTYFSDCLIVKNVSGGYKNANYEIRRK